MTVHTPTHVHGRKHVTWRPAWKSDPCPVTTRKCYLKLPSQPKLWSCAPLVVITNHLHTTIRQTPTLSISLRGFEKHLFPVSTSSATLLPAIYSLCACPQRLIRIRVLDTRPSRHSSPRASQQYPTQLLCLPALGCLVYWELLSTFATITGPWAWIESLYDEGSRQGRFD